jgi:hypothetical protein
MYEVIHRRVARRRTHPGKVVQYHADPVQEHKSPLTTKTTPGIPEGCTSLYKPKQALRYQIRGIQCDEHKELHTCWPGFQVCGAVVSEVVFVCLFERASRPARAKIHHRGIDSPMITTNNQLPNEYCLLISFEHVNTSCIASFARVTVTIADATS